MMFPQNGTDYGFLVRQNSELLRALEELEKTCTALKDENGLLRKSSAPETEEKVRRLRRKNTELAVLAKRLEERARKLQEANLRVNSPSLLRPGTGEHYKRAFARQRARDLAHHADTLLSKDKEFASLQNECRALEAQLGGTKGSHPVSSGGSEFERLLRESQKEVLRLQRQLAVTSCSRGGRDPSTAGPPRPPDPDGPPGPRGPPDPAGPNGLEGHARPNGVGGLHGDLDDPGRAGETPSRKQDEQTRAENEDLREDLSEVTAQRNSVLEENQRLRAKLENLEQVLKHMREVAERRQQLELEHEQALAILKFKQDEIKRLQRAQLFAKREHEGVVHMLEVSHSANTGVRDLEEKCRSQSEQFGMLSHELDQFRVQTSKVDLASTSLLSSPNLSVLTNGVVGLPMERGNGEERHPWSHSGPGWLSVFPWCPQVDTASEVEELDVDIAPAPYSASRGAAKLQVFIGRYSYNPYDGPNDNPEVELPLTAGEYIYVYGDMDDDGFYEGELMDGRRGLVPSNFVERVSDDDVMGSQQPETTDPGSHNSLLDASLHSASPQHHLPPHQHHLAAAGPRGSERTEAAAAAPPVPAPRTLSPVGLDVVPYPRRLTLIKQLAKSIIIGWDPPLVAAGWGDVWSYNVYVDQELRLNVPFGAQTKAVLERLDVHLKAYRVSVQSLTERGPSDRLACSLLVGRDVCVAPTQLRVDRVTATAAHLSWLPSNSNYVHIVSLNEEECELVKAGCYSLCLSNLAPSLQYSVKVEARPHRTPWELPLERREHRSATTAFSTLMAGPPDAPLDVQLEQGPSPGIALISWLPVTIDAAGTSNGVRVTGYTIYADKKKVLEVSSPTAGSALLGPSQIHSLQLFLCFLCVCVFSFSRLPECNVHSSFMSFFCLSVSCAACSFVFTSPPPPPPPPPPSATSRTPPTATRSPPSASSPSPARPATTRTSSSSPRKRAGAAPSTASPAPGPPSPTPATEPGPAPSTSIIAPGPTPATPTTPSSTTTTLRPESLRPPATGGAPGPSSSGRATPTRRAPPVTPTTTANPASTRGPAATGCLAPRRPPPRRPLAQCAWVLWATGGCADQWVFVCSSTGATEPQPSVGEGDVRIFVALFPYDPTSMSPNTDASEDELPFREGQIIKVYGEKDADGFYRGESAGRHGYVPCNMVSELQVEDEETRQQLLHAVYLSVPHIDSSLSAPASAAAPTTPTTTTTPAVGNPGPGARRMVAIFDYDPRESSPNTDIEAELTFSAGDTIHVFGDMDDDGFFYGDLNGHKGLVPSNFLQALPDEDPPAPPPLAQPAPEPKRDPQVGS
uniref:SH3 domain-containing protein n=1 Tax=Gadus morhua TaxID=8049 RepID=A0A8C5B0F4_GADMO